MKLIFETENNNHYAVALEAEYKDQICEALWYAEIEPKGNGFIIRWDDNYSNQIPSDTLENAKELILREYTKHTPQVVGKRYEI